MHVKDKSIFLI